MECAIIISLVNKQRPLDLTQGLVLLALIRMYLKSSCLPATMDCFTHSHLLAMHALGIH